MSWSNRGHIEGMVLYYSDPGKEKNSNVFLCRNRILQNLLQ